MSTAVKAAGTGTAHAAARRLFAGPAAILLLLSLPLWMPTYWLFLSSQSAVYTVAVLSVMVLRRATDSTSLCQAALMGVAAYLAAWLSSAQGWSYPAAVLAGLLATVPAGMALALPALRLRGLELSVLTLAVGLAATAIVFDPLAPLKFSDRGAPLSGPPHPFGVDVTSPGRMYLFLFLLAGAALLLVRLLFRSRLGLTWQALRAGNAAAAASGIPVARMQVLGFVLSAGLAGLSGVMLLTLQQTVTADSFSTAQSVFLVVVAALIGGDRPGLAVLGGAVVGLGQQVFGAFGLAGDWIVFLFGLVVVLHILTVASLRRGTSDG
jgi:ABC-type branched-subunit amino acid transport system permease subunit